MISTRCPQTGRQVPDASVRINRQAVAFANRGDQAPSVLRVQPLTFTEYHVFPDAQFVDQAEVLVDHSDAEQPGPRWAIDSAALTVDIDRAFVGLHETDQYLHQRRLTGTVLSEHSMDLSTFQVEVDLGAGDHFAVALCEAAHRNGRLLVQIHHVGNSALSGPAGTLNDRFFLALRFNPKSELVDAGQAAGCAIVGARLKSTDLNDVEDLGSFTLGVLHGAHEVPFAVDSERLDLVRAGGRLRVAEAAVSRCVDQNP